MMSIYLKNDVNVLINDVSLLLFFNFITAKIAIDKSTLIRRNDVYTFVLLFLFVSIKKNRLRDKLNKRVHELFQTFFNQKELN
jgi:hypothetical protein